MKDKSILVDKNILQTRFKLIITGAICEAKTAAGIDHPALSGTIREILVEQMLQPALSPEVRFGTGKLLDNNGNLSKQMDIVLYSPKILPPGLFDERTGLFPMESCLYTIEVKSKLNATNLKEAINNAKSSRLLSPANTFYFNGMKSTTSGTPLPIHALFAFDSDLEGSGKSELDRYIEIDPSRSPAISVICVVGKGYWYSGEEGWQYYQASDDHTEVLSFLAGISNTMPKLLSAKGRPQFGSYLIEDKGGKLIKPDI